LSAKRTYSEIVEVTELWSDTASGPKDAIRDKLAPLQRSRASLIATGRTP
jgi:hypothetical protein